MLQPVGTGPAVVACTTCRFSADRRDGADGRRGGAVLADLLRTVQAGDPAYAAIAIQAMPCLFACADHCTVHLRGPARVGYVLGRFTPDEAAARAILDFAVRHAASDWGQVPYREWPEGVKGHFLTRTPPEGYVVA